MTANCADFIKKVFKSVISCEFKAMKYSNSVQIWIDNAYKIGDNCVQYN